MILLAALLLAALSGAEPDAVILEDTETTEEELAEFGEGDAGVTIVTFKK